MGDEIYESAPKEEEEPFSKANKALLDPNKHKNDMESRNQKYAYRIIVICIAVICAIYASGFISVIFFKDAMSDITTMALDLFKTVLMFVIGYLFGNKR